MIRRWRCGWRAFAGDFIVVVQLATNIMAARPIKFCESFFPRYNSALQPDPIDFCRRRSEPRVER